MNPVSPTRLDSLKQAAQAGPLESPELLAQLAGTGSDIIQQAIDTFVSGPARTADMSQQACAALQVLSQAVDDVSKRVTGQIDQNKAAILSRPQEPLQKGSVTPDSRCWDVIPHQEAVPGLQPYGFSPSPADYTAHLAYQKFLQSKPAGSWSPPLHYSGTNFTVHLGDEQAVLRAAPSHTQGLLSLRDALQSLTTQYAVALAGGAPAAACFEGLQKVQQSLQQGRMVPAQTASLEAVRTLAETARWCDSGTWAEIAVDRPLYWGDGQNVGSNVVQLNRDLAETEGPYEPAHPEFMAVPTAPAPVPAAPPATLLPSTPPPPEPPRPVTPATRAPMGPVTNFFYHLQHSGIYLR